MLGAEGVVESGGIVNQVGKLARLLLSWSICQSNYFVVCLVINFSASRFVQIVLIWNFHNQLSLIKFTFFKDVNAQYDK